MGRKNGGKYCGIGGQALIEGVMMRGPGKTAIAVREAGGGITVESFRESRLSDKHKWLGFPVVRGVVNFAESLLTGFKAMSRSMELSGMLDEPEDEPGESEAKEKPDAPAESKAVEPTRSADGGGPVADSRGESGPDTADKADRAEKPDIADDAGRAEKPDIASEIVGAEKPVLADNPDSRDKPDKPSEPNKPNNPEKAKKPDKSDKSGSSEERAMTAITAVSAVLGVALAVLLFMYLPTFLFDLLRRAAGDGLLPFKALIEGGVKVLIFLGYLMLISGMKDIKRTFRYHGAEHKTIFCYEAGLPLTVENAREMKRFHPRCGTSFILLMIVVSVFINGLLLFLFPGLAANRWLWVAIKVLMIPLVCSLGYEVLRLCGKYDNIATRIISTPGLWIQRLTTKEPDDGMLEVAIASLMAVLPEDEAPREGETSAGDRGRDYGSANPECREEAAPTAPDCGEEESSNPKPREETDPSNPKPREETDPSDPELQVKADLSGPEPRSEPALAAPHCRDDADAD